ncbi:MAG: protoporphyrinogen oxidase [Trueperaceae bacterium]
MSGVRFTVIGGGVAGLSAAYDLLRLAPEAEVTVFEREAEPGGTARTVQVAGYRVDTGPAGFLNRPTDALDLAVELGLQDELKEAGDAARRRYLVRSGELHPAPMGPAAMLRSPLLGLGAKARIALEPFVARAPRSGRDVSDESAYAFAARRLGTGFADAFVAPLVAGISAGDARTTSMAALFPRMVRLEAEHGGLVRGMLAQRRAARRGRGAGPRSAGPAGPAGRLTSFQGGAGRLAEALHEQLAGRVRLGAEVVGVTPGRGDGWSVRVADGSEVVTDALVLAAPAYVAADLARSAAPAAVSALAAIPYAGVRVVALGFKRSALTEPLDGFGFLAARGQGVRVLGCQWASTLFPQQAPEGHVLIRAVAGGALDPGFVDLDEDDAIDAVLQDLRALLGVRDEPAFAHVVTWERGIPQYTLGHQQRVAAARAAVQRLPRFELAGNAYDGLGLNDTVRSARAAARRLVAAIRAG